MSFIPPTWYSGLLFYIVIIIIPILISVGILIIGLYKDSYKVAYLGGALIIISVLVCVPLGNVAWHYNYEVPSVQEKIITVDNWQPTFGKYWGDIESANDLMMQTKDGELFANQENFLFQKFNTRDILNNLHVNGTYKIKYYGWREGYNNGVPNILSITEVIDENGTQSNDITHYMNKRSIIYEDSDHR